MSRHCPTFFKSIKLSTLFFLSSMLLITPILSQAAELFDVRGKRYCEIILFKTPTQILVYSTFGLNDCPSDIWQKITVGPLKKATGASFVRLNGPRYWMMDGIKSTPLAKPENETLSGLTLRKVAEIIINPDQFFSANIPYQTRNIKRRTTWTYEAGKPIYELIDSKGHVFVMQSYSLQISPQTEASLPQLAVKLRLPPGWQFKTGVLKKTETISTVNDMATVVLDDFFNTYQQATHDLLKE
ncbi:hypothetical protein [Legionella maioricensis]|uniref:Uncharacterized protein n=1 Tax=Legionella maioricensis TaxID=2896528 RepID=A0A9X2D2X8_9GAMM|nr:hypothetical protein [Legionella maioricensis]MCL9685483.1 hypothetical protein [Legionella maioricensis]MCL9688809.1 hypothetical protein [Legionella maioricensis]